MPAGRDLSLLAVGVVAVGVSGPLIAASALPVIALIFWRNFAGAIVTAPFAIREWLRSGSGNRRVGTSLLAGLLLAAHFICFFIAMRWTSVAAGTALTATQPVFAALMARYRGHIVPVRAWWGMAIAFIGVVVIGGVDYSLSTRALLGDLIAIAGGAFAAAYVTVTAVARRHVSTSVHTTICYAACALIMAGLAVPLGVPLAGYIGREWLIILGLIIGPQLLGHSVFNLVLKTTSATVVSMIVLFETPVAAIIAAAWLAQVPALSIYPAIIILLVGSALVVTRR